jgi:hypothetical protein
MKFALTQYQKNINIHQYTMVYDDVSFVYQYPATLDCLWFSDEAHFHHERFMNKQNMRFQALENPHRVTEMSLHPIKCTNGMQSASTGLLD